ncbi:molybdopterin molybdotransferase MoeA [Aurantiacibacter gangjinensis]|uniref:Molybdopterin molybdenumtransferase n=1 Tax=Aurantiacibacter gangjinensis TaxID=502682 RepID=A0A0G9MQH1_9SPHN|nr:molybdopterin molybdotransferase MoeA [Aurantiacibacter gangjinensis]APE28811.1 Molybdopterin biosynthesis protein MoeA [Aurantiacibacter gangjinensis]KLE32960.1 hypothetical protein AAW01_02815 [Aurantiacibacter gangjinensis]
MSLLPLDEAQRRLLEGTHRLPTEDVPLDAAHGRYLANDVVAKRNQPAADLSAMDGYAMLAGDDGGPWTVIGESAAGHPFGGSLARGQCVRISTGALLPTGASAILIQENAGRKGDVVTLAGGDGPSADLVRRRAFDFAQGDTVLVAGSRVDAPQLALARMAGHRSLAVGKRPALAVIDCGDELSDAASLPDHRIPATNGSMVQTMCAPLARDARRIGPVADSMDALLGALAETADADVIVTSGGASVGDHDLVRPALERWGAELGFWRVAIKPGKPLLIARRGATTLVGLPGNPASAYVTAFLFVLPLLRHLAGASDAFPRAVQLSLGEPLPETGVRAELFRARLHNGYAVPIAQRDSSALQALAAADLLIHRPVGAEAAAAGELVSAYLIQNGGIA